jgi:hypothetical protein
MCFFEDSAKTGENVREMFAGVLQVDSNHCLIQAFVFVEADISRSVMRACVFNRYDTIISIHRLDQAELCVIHFRLVLDTYRERREFPQNHEQSGMHQLPLQHRSNQDFHW